MRRTPALVAGFVLGLVASACGPVKEIGPTALVLEVYFSEKLGTKALLVSGTAEVDGVLVNVFPTSQRPEELGASFPVPQTVRVLLNDSRAGKPLQLIIIGLDGDGDAVEAATQTVTPRTQRETLVTITLKPFTDSVEPDGGNDGGFVFDAGPRDAGTGGRDAGVCPCGSTCCEPSSVRCATPVLVPLASQLTLVAFPIGPTGQVCNSVCPLGKASQVDGGQCQCGTGPACADGLRCQVSGASARCVCDKSSGCRGCCANGAVCEARAGATCGNAGNACARCEGVTNLCLAAGRCSLSLCPPASPTSNQCCSGLGTVTSQWPTCQGTSGDCVACDVLRSNVCRPVGVGVGSQPCGCGLNGQCGSDSHCLAVAGVPTCVLRP